MFFLSYSSDSNSWFKLSLCEVLSELIKTQRALTCNVFWFPFECILYIIVPLRCSVRSAVLSISLWITRAASSRSFSPLSGSQLQYTAMKYSSAGFSRSSVTFSVFTVTFLFCTWLDRPLSVSPSGAQFSCISSDLLQFLFFAVYHSLFSAQLSHFALFSEWKTDKKMENRVKYWKYHTSRREEIMFPTVLKESDIHLVKSAAPIFTQTLVNISLWQRRELFCIVLYFKVQLKVFNIKRTSDPFIFASSLYVCFKFKQLLTSENNIKTHKKRESGYFEYQMFKYAILYICSSA